MNNVRPLTLAETAEALLSIDRAAILTHVHPDGDTYASAIALAELFRLLGREAYIFSADPIPERLAFLSPYAPPRFPQDGDEGTLTAVAVDVASPEQLGALKNRFSPVLTLDHHETSTPFSAHYTLPGVSSAGEVVYRVAASLLAEGKIPEFSSTLVYALYAAISSDTGCFKFSCASPETHRIAADLIDMGAPHAEINHALFDSKPMEQIRAEAQVSAALTLYADGKIAVATVTADERRRKKLSLGAYETAVDVVRSVRGVEIAAVFKESDVIPGRYKVSMRATRADVASVAAIFGGGGHLLAAGCTVDAHTPKGAVAALLPYLEKLL